MTLDNTNRRIQYCSNGSLLCYPFEFRVWNDSQVKVYQGDELRPWEDEDITSQVTVCLNEKNLGGYVLFHSPPANGTCFAIVREMPFLQEDEYISGSRFDAHEIEDRFDMDAAERQELLDGLNRAIKVPNSGSQTAEELYESLFCGSVTVNTAMCELSDLYNCAKYYYDLVINNLAGGAYEEGQEVFFRVQHNNWSCNGGLIDFTDQALYSETSGFETNWIGFQYYVGKKQLTVTVDGLVLNPETHYLEIGLPGDLSSCLCFTIPLYKDQEVYVKASFLGSENYTLCLQGMQNCIDQFIAGELGGSGSSGGSGGSGGSVTTACDSTFDWFFTPDYPGSGFCAPLEGTYIITAAGGGGGGGGGGCSGQGGWGGCATIHRKLLQGDCLCWYIGCGGQGGGSCDNSCCGNGGGGGGGGTVVWLACCADDQAIEDDQAIGDDRAIGDEKTPIIVMAGGGGGGGGGPAQCCTSYASTTNGGGGGGGGGSGFGSGGGGGCGSSGALGGCGGCGGGCLGGGPNAAGSGRNGGEGGCGGSLYGTLGSSLYGCGGNGGGFCCEYTETVEREDGTLEEVSCYICFCGYCGGRMRNCISGGCKMFYPPEGGHGGCLTLIVGGGGGTGAHYPTQTGGAGGGSPHGGGGDGYVCCCSCRVANGYGAGGQGNWCNMGGQGGGNRDFGQFGGCGGMGGACQGECGKAGGVGWVRIQF